MSSDNLSAVLYAKNDLRLEQRPIPEPGPEEVLIQISKVGICGSDVSFLTQGKIGPLIVTSPMILGHESAGVVVKSGSKVANLKVGDRVAIEPAVPCRKCEYCKIGRYNLCPDEVVCSVPPKDGTLSRYYKHAADFCFKLPDHVTLEEGALLEPLSVGVHACRRANVTLGDYVLILGSGPVGLTTLLAAQAMGASKICITDLLENRLKTAVELGAHQTLLVSKDDDPQKLASVVKNKMGKNPDIVFDCNGCEATMRLGILSVKSGGVLIMVGFGHSDITLPMVDAAYREVDIKGTSRYANDYPLSLEMVASGKVDVKKLITHRYKLEDSLQAFETSRTGAGGAMKVMISCD